MRRLSAGEDGISSMFAEYLKRAGNARVKRLRTAAGEGEERLDMFVTDHNVMASCLGVITSEKIFCATFNGSTQCQPPLSVAVVCCGRYISEEKHTLRMIGKPRQGKAFLWP